MAKLVNQDPWIEWLKSCLNVKESEKEILDPHQHFVVMLHPLYKIEMEICEVHFVKSCW